MAASVHEDTRARIQQVALELFAEHGYEKTSLREIADRLEVTKAALYYHFPSKDALLASIVGGIFDELDEILGSYEPGPVSAPRRRALLADYIDLVLRHRTVMRLLVSDISALANLDIGVRAKREGARAQALLVSPDAPLAKRVRASAAFGVIRNGFVSFLDVPAEELRGPFLAAALGAFGSR